MGRYIRKSKPVGELVLMEVAQSSSLGGVRTRAKTLALQRLQKLSAATVAAVTGAADGSPVTGGSYLQLRNRRLAKPPIPGVVSKRRKLYLSNSSPSSNFRDSGSKSSYRRIEEKNSRSSVSVSIGGSEKVEQEEKIEEKENGDLSIETSFGENMLEIDGKESTRESTPISLIRDPQMVTTPGSTTRPERSSRINSMRIDHSFPTTEELDLFFADSEQLQKKQFIDKYNFDPAKEEPLPGRFKWVKPNL